MMPDRILFQKNCIMMSKRLFIAVDISLSDDVVSLLAKLKQKLSRDNIKWVPTHNFHLTLKFLGDTEESLIPELISQMEIIAKQFTPFELTVKSLGTFSSAKFPKVIWLGIDDKENTLSSIASNLNKSLSALGFDEDKRTFKAHLTLARIKFINNPQILNNLVRSYRDTVFHRQVIEKLILYESILKPSGPVYKPLAEISL